MKVAYVLTTGRGGLPHYTAELANAISKYADVVVIKPKVTTADDIFSDKIEIINAFEHIPISFIDIYKKSIFTLKNIKGLLSYKNIKIIDEIKPDIIHFPAGLLPPAQIFFKLYKLDKKYPTVLTFHDVLPRKLIMLPSLNMHPNEPFLNVIAINIGNFLDLIMPKITINKIIVHTQKNKDELIKSGIATSEKVVIIPHGAYDFFKNYYKSNKSKEERNCILFFGNIVVVKALDVLIDAMPLIIREIPDVKLIIAGDGVIPKRCWQIIEKYKSNFEIHNYFIPNERVWEFFTRAGVVVIPNRKQEGHSGSLTVAYSFGKPVVTTNVGEFPLLVEKTGCGLVVPPENPKALAEAIIRLLRNNKLRKKMSRNALKMAEKLSWDNVAKMHIKVYNEVLNEWDK